MTHEQLHNQFLGLGGHAPRWNPLDHYLIRSWYEFERAGYTDKDLEQVMRYKRERVKEGWNSACLTFRNTVYDLSKFGEHLSLSRGMKPVKSDRDRVLEMSGRQAVKEMPTRRVSECDWKKGIEEMRRVVDDQP